MGSVSFENETRAIKRNILVFKLVVPSDFGLKNLEEHHKFKITIVFLKRGMGFQISRLIFLRLKDKIPLNRNLISNSNLNRNLNNN